jgi:putative transposase
MFWGWRSGKPRWRKVGPELRDLIHQMRRDNPTWGVKRIQGERRKIGFNISHVAVYNYLPKQFSSPSPGWRVFLRNHMKETAAVDFMVVVTVTFQLLYAMVLISHSRRRILHLGITANPTQEWVMDQLRQAFRVDPKPKYLVRDRDAIYGRKVSEGLKEIGIKEKLTTRQSPWQNIFVERVIGSIRRECLDHVIIANERHLRRILASYIQYYNFSRTHKSLDLDCPVHRPIERPVRGRKIVAIPFVGGLHHRYERRAA